MLRLGSHCLSLQARRRKTPSYLFPMLTMGLALIIFVLNAVARMRNDPQPTPDSTSHQTIIDRTSNSIVYQVVDNRTSLVVRQFPEEAMLRRRAYFHALDLMKSNPVREPATDRLA